MLYRALGNTGIKLSAIGFGTNRFSPDDLTTEEGIHKAAAILRHGIALGINYIDCAHNYSLGKAEEIVRIALSSHDAQTTPVYTSTKTMFTEDKTDDAAIRRIETSLISMGLEHVTFGFLWKVLSYAEFRESRKKGGTLDGLIKAKEAGLIEHICVSSHASAGDTKKILESGIFSGCIISCNVLNVAEFSELISFAKNKGIGIITMNSLGGGTIPKLDYLFNAGEDARYTLPQKALMALYAHEGITCMLSSMESIKQVEENVAPFKSEEKFNPPMINQVNLFTNNQQLCTKCRYCSGCPVNIPIADMMYAYTNRIFGDMKPGYENSKICGKDYVEEDLREARKTFNSPFFDENAVPETTNNPCIQCGRCEKICTQKLPIIESIGEVFRLAKETNFSHESRKKRIDFLIGSQLGYKRVGFFPAGKYTVQFIKAYLQYFDNFPFELFVFDNNPSVWGEEIYPGIKVYSPNEIPIMKPELLLVTNFRFGDEIFDRLMEDERFFVQGMIVKKLHQKGDVAWF